MVADDQRDETGVVGVGTGTGDVGATLTLIGRLLRQAESTTHPAERDAFMSRAMLLATRHDVDVAVARAHAAGQERREEPEEQTVEIGAAGTRSLAHYVRLYVGVAAAFDVRCFVASDATRVHPVGFPSDIAVVGMLYESLVVQMVAAGDAYVRAGGYKGDLVWNRRRRRWTRVHAATARQQFYAGFVAEVSRRLQQARQASRAEAVAAERGGGDGPQAALPGTPSAGSAGPVGSGPSVELALRSKELAVARFFERRTKEERVTRSWRGGGGTVGHAGSRAAGREAGRRADLHQRGRRRGLGPGGSDGAS